MISFRESLIRLLRFLISILILQIIYDILKKHKASSIEAYKVNNIEKHSETNLKTSKIPLYKSDSKKSALVIH